MEKRVRQGSLRTSFIRNILLILGLSYILTLAVLLSFVRAYFYTNFYNTLKSGLQQSADYYTDNLASAGSPIENLYNDQDSWWRTDAARVQIYDSDALLLLDSQAQLEPESDLSDVQTALTGRAEYQIFRIARTSEHVMSISSPLIATGEVIGVLRHIASLEQVDQNLRNITILFFQIGGVITAASAFLGVIISRRMIRPISELTDTARSMARGDYSVRSQVRSSDEIGTLSETFNHMASEIAKKEELKNDFISSVSHELRTPLTAIKGWAMTLNNPATDPELLAVGLDIIVKESDRLKLMVDELLDFSRFAAGKIELNAGWVEPEQLKNYIQSFAERRGERDPRSFEMVMTGTAEPFWGDENRLKQVLINLIDNAFKFTEPGDMIRVEIAQDAAHTILCVEDTGIGISAEEIPKVREKFYKGKHSQSANGIGLSIVNEIALLHGGSLEIESQLEKGTVMRVKIPREKKHAKKTK